MQRIPAHLIYMSLLGLAVSAQAQVEAPVVEARPIYAPAAPATESHCTYDHPSRSRQTAARVLGGLAGGYAGNQIGSGSGQDLATIVGAIAGSEIAAAQARRPSRRCAPARAPEDAAEVAPAIAGYDVIYRHAGRLWRTRRSEHPGKTISVPDRREAP